MAFSKLMILFLLLAPTLVFSARSNGVCKPSGFLFGTDGDNCELCCEDGVKYPKFTCSPPVTSATKALLTVNDFASGGDGGGASSCTETFHDGTVEKVVALSTGWFDNRSRCNQKVVVTANGISVVAKVVDECDSRNGCDEEHAGQPPCRNNIVDASQAVWDELGISEDDPSFGEIKITWTDA